jgi:hypothetical protein
MTTTPATVQIPAQAEPADAPAQVDQGHGGRIITALEHAWAALRANHPDMPEVVMITGTKKQLGGQRWGHYGPDFWAVPGGGNRASELFIAGELIAQGGRQVLEVLIHEGGHGVAHTRGIKDCSGDGNRYHNKRFVKIVEEMGLKAPAQSAKTHGWSFCTVTDETVTKYAAVIAELEAARLPYLGAPIVTTGGDDEGQGEDDTTTGGEDEPKKKRRAGKRFAIVCQCEKPRRLQVSPKAAEDGPIICGLCRAEFEPEQTDEEEADDE